MVINHEGLSPKVFEKFEYHLVVTFTTSLIMVTVYYLGNPYQITWSDYKDPRGFHIFDTETRELEFILNPYEIFHKIYYDEKIGHLKKFKSLIIHNTKVM